MRTGVSVRTKAAGVAGSVLCGESVDEISILIFRLRVTGGDLFLGIRPYDQVDGKREAMAISPEHFPQKTFDPVSGNGVSCFPRDHEAEPGPFEPVDFPDKLDVTGAIPKSFSEDGIELFTFTESVFFSEPKRAAVYTVRRLRPLARRRARTFRPFLVLIRVKNPWVRFRR